MNSLRLGVIWAAVAVSVQVACGQQAGVSGGLERVLAESKERVAQVESALTKAEHLLGTLMMSTNRGEDNGQTAFGVASHLRSAAEQMILIETSLAPYKYDSKYLYREDLEAVIWQRAWPERNRQIVRLVSVFNALIGVQHNISVRMSQASREAVGKTLAESIGPTYEPLTKEHWSTEISSRGKSLSQTDLAISALNSPEAMPPQSMAKSLDVPEEQSGDRRSQAARTSSTLASGTEALPESPNITPLLGDPTSNDLRLSLALVPIVAVLSIAVIGFVLRVVFLKGAKAAANAR